MSIALFALLGVAPASAHAALGDISSVAGGYPSGPVAATSVGQHPTSVATVTLGGHPYTYVADPAHDVVTRIDDSTGQQQVIAGTGTPGFSGDGGLATSAQLDDPQAVAVDPGGNVAIADGGDRIRFVAAFSATAFGQSVTAGDIYTIAGNGTAGYTGDTGPATSAEINNGPGFLGIPGGGLAFDGAGNLAIADSLNNVVRFVESIGIHTHFGQSMTPGHIYTIAGTGTACSPSTAVCGDGGAAASAKLNSPLAVAFDGANGDLAVADTEDQRVRFVAQGASSFGGTAVTANDIYTVAGTGSAGSGCTGVNLPATSLNLGNPIGVSFTPSGGIVIGDTNDACVRFVSNTSTGYICTPIAAGDMCTIAGNGTFGFVGDGGTANAAELSAPEGVSVGTDGLAIADTQNSRVRFVPTASGSLFGGFKTAGDIYTVAGNGTTGFSGDGMPATGTELSVPTAVAVAPQGGFAITDFDNNRIRFVPSASGNLFGQSMAGGDMYTIAGNGSSGASGDGGPATGAQLSQPEGARFDAAGDMIIADRFNNKVRFVPATSGTFFGQAMTAGDIYTIAGNGTAAFGGDGGPGPAAELQQPSGVFADSSGVVIADTQNFRVRFVAARSGTFFAQSMTAGDIYTIAGNGTQGFAGDGGPASSAEFKDPEDVVEDSSGDLFMSDGSNNRVRFVPATSGTFFGQSMTAGDIYTIAGNGTAGSTGDGGAPAAAELNFPEGLAVDSIGDLAIADSSGQRVRFIPARSGDYFGPTMTAGDIYTIAGNGTQGFSGDGGAATSAEFNFPTGLAIDATGDVLIADSSNNRVRMVSGTIPAPGGGTGPGSGTGPGGGTGPGSGTGPVIPTGLVGGKLKVTKVAVHGTKVAVALSCVGATQAKCAGKLKLTVTETLRRGKVIAVTAASRNPKTKKKVVVVGSASTTLSGGKRKTVTISLNRAGKHLLAHRRKLKVTLTVTQGRRTVYRHKETLVKPKPKPKRHRRRPAADLAWWRVELNPG